MTRSGWVILIAALALIPSVVFGDSAVVPSVPLAMLDGSSLTGKTGEKSKEMGVASSEVLRGNGSRAGYILGHGNVIPGSEWVFVGLKRARVNADYSIDYASGSIYFVEAVRQTDSVKVDYRYSESAGSERNLTGSSMMPLRFGNSLQTNLTYSYRAADPEKSGAPDILTYGMNTTTMLGGSSSISSLMYIATPQTPNRLAISGAQQAKSDAPAVKRDRLMVQDADLGLGKVVRLKLGLQDVGEDFAGFTSLRDSKATKDDVLGMLEKEKGIKRTNMGVEISTGKAAGLSFSTGRIVDKQDRISTQAFGFSSRALKMDYNVRDIGKTFARFTDLREADRAQMAAESGIKRTSYGLHLATGSKAGGQVWSGMSFMRLQDESGGALTCRSSELELGPVKVETDSCEMDPGFNRMTSLSDEERTRMAMIARRQFDPNAQSSQVSAEDKTQVNKEAGLNRRSVGVEVASRPGKIWLGLASADSGKGGLVRRDISFQGKNLLLYFGRQKIDEGFDRIAHMQAVEQARFGNETGMSRTEAGGNFKLSFGEIALFHAGVTDHQNAGVSRSSVDFKNARLKFHANFQDIDPNFSRITDLSDTDRQLMLQERGFSKSEYAINLQATKTLNIDSYVYDSTNSTAEQARSQNRHKITYTPDKGPQVTALKDDFSYISDSGNLSSYSHQRITFDNKLRFFGGLLFKGMHDVNVNQESVGLPVTTDVTQAHLETDQNARTSFTLDSLQTDFGDRRRFEDSWDVGAKTQLWKNFKLTGGFSRTAREADNSEVNGRVGFDWQVRKDLSLSLRVANRDGGPQGSQQSTQFSMKGSLLKRILMFKDVNVDSGVNTNQLKGKQVSCDNGLKVDAGMMSGKVTFDNSDKLNPQTGVYYTSRVAQYESDSNPNKPYHVRFFRQNLITPTGEPAQKRNYALDARLSKNTGFTLTSYFGKDGLNGAVLPVGGTVFKITRALSSKLSLIADFTADRNEATQRHARTMGFGFTGTLNNKAGFELYAGWCHLIENGPQEHDRVFRFKYDRKIDSDHFFSVTAQKRSAVERSSINPFEGEATARVDFKTLFN